MDEEEQNRCMREDRTVEHGAQNRFMKEVPAALVIPNLSPDITPFHDMASVIYAKPVHLLVHMHSFTLIKLSTQ